MSRVFRNFRALAVTLLVALLLLGSFAVVQAPQAAATHNLSCGSLAYEIARARDVIVQRREDILVNQHDLNFDGKQSVISHRGQLDGWKNRAQRLLREYNEKRCTTDIPNDVWNWAWVELPWPREDGKWNCWGRAGTWEYSGWTGWTYTAWGSCDFEFGGGGGFGDGNGGGGGGSSWSVGESSW